MSLTIVNVAAVPLNWWLTRREVGAAEKRQDSKIEGRLSRMGRYPNPGRMSEPEHWLAQEEAVREYVRSNRQAAEWDGRRYFWDDDVKQVVVEEMP